MCWIELYDVPVYRAISHFWTSGNRNEYPQSHVIYLTRCKSWKFTSLEWRLRKMFHFIFDYNYGNSWWLLIIFVPLETEMNTLPSMHKQCHFNLTTSPLYLVKLKIVQNGLPLTAVRSVEPIVPNLPPDTHYRLALHALAICSRPL